MKEKLFAIIGNPVSHSLSPTLHNYWFKKYKITAKYSLMQSTDKNLKKIISDIRSKKIDGINVTLPFKQKIIKFVDKIVNDAQATNSVNTVYLDENNTLIGDNTDVFGIQAAYLKEITDFES